MNIIIIIIIGIRIRSLCGAGFIPKRRIEINFADPTGALKYRPFSPKERSASQLVG